MSSKIIPCKQCGTDVSIPIKEYNRQIKKGRGPDKFFCNLSCAADYNNANLTKEQLEKRRSVFLKNIAEHPPEPGCNKKGDFTYYLKKIRDRNGKYGKTDLSEEYLSSIWSGKCAFSGLSINLRNYKTPTDKFRTASLDRIDSSRGYVKGNVQFVCAALNLAKCDGTDAEFRKFLEELRS